MARTSIASKPPPVISRVALFEQLLDALRDLILDGELAPGSRLPEPELCERFGTSRTPLREAFKMLASEGLVELQTFRGAFVAMISEKETREVAFMLSTLEQAAAKTIVKSASDQDLADFAKVHKAMIAAAARGDISSYRKLNEAIHASFVTLTGNSVMIDSYNRIKNRLTPTRHIRTRTAEDLQLAITDHEAMMAALAARDGRRLASIIGQHYTAAISASSSA
jgi:DNA-binding GntR family transcriptional regulator